PSRKDFMPRKSLEERIREARNKGEKVLQHLLLSMRFSLRYEQFVTQAAHALRRYVVYRTDGGHFARGLVRASSNAWEIYQHYRSLQWEGGEKLRLETFVIRRKAHAAENRWVLSVEFWPHFSDVDVEPGEGDAISVPPKGPKKHVEDILDRALVIAGTIPG